MPHILIVEDDEDLQFLYDAALTRYGYTITSAKNTGDAIAYLNNDEFDLIILDINMPDMPGIRVLELKQQDARLHDVPIVVVSAIDQYREQALALGVDYYLIKPLPLQDLLAVISSVLA